VSTGAPRQLYIVVTEEWQPGINYRAYITLKGLREAARKHADPIWDAKDLEVWSVGLEGSGHCERTTFAALGAAIGPPPPAWKECIDRANRLERLKR
jgi:hypothetical protein